MRRKWRRLTVRTEKQFRSGPRVSERLGMAVHNRFKVKGEFAVQRNHGTVLPGQAERFREPPQRGLDSRAQHDSGRCGVVDDDLGSGANAGRHTGKVVAGVGFRDVDGCHTHDDTAIFAHRRRPVDGTPLRGCPESCSSRQGFIAVSGLPASGLVNFGSRSRIMTGSCLLQIWNRIWLIDNRLRCDQ